MAEDSQREDGAPRDGVFGNLPDSRPGTRSPRRGADNPPRKRGERPAGKAAATEEPRRREAPSAEATTEGSGGIEDLAWAGVAAAAEAATLGVRLASRAIDALRGSSERD